MVRWLIVLAVSISAMALCPLTGAAQEQGQPSDQVLVVGRSSRNKAVDDYINVTRSAIQTAWTTPADLDVPSAVKGNIRVNLLISRSGSLESFKLIEGSGNQEVDQSIVEAIRKAAPFPPFPRDISSAKMLIRANLVVANLPSVRPITVSGTAAEMPAIIEPGAAQAPAWGKPAGSSTEKPMPPIAPVSPPNPDNPPKKILKWGSR